MSLTPVGCALVALAALAGCHEPPAELALDCPSITGRDPAREFGTPDQLAPAGCVPDGLVGFDRAPVYLVAGASAGIAGELLHLDDACGALTTQRHAAVELTADYLYWSQPEQAGYVCRDGLGRLRGRYASCFSFDGDESCFAVEIELRRFATLDEPEAAGFALVAEVPPPAALAPAAALTLDVRVEDDVAYLVMRGGLLLIDVHAPASPAVLAFVPGALDAFNDVDLYTGGDGRRYAIVTGRGHVFLDVTDPRRPVEVRRMTLDGGHTVVTEVRGDRTLAYLASGRDAGIRILDVTDPHAVIPLGRWPYPTHDLQIVDRIAYVNATTEGFQVVDVADPSAPVLLGTTPDVGYSHAVAVTTAGGRRVAVHGDEGRGSHIRIIDVEPSSPEFMQVIGERRIESDVSAHNVIVRGERAYVAWYQHGLRLLDLADPTDPVEIGHHQTWDADATQYGYFEGALGVDLAAAPGVVFVADSSRGLLVFAEDQVPGSRPGQRASMPIGSPDDVRAAAGEAIAW